MKSLRDAILSVFEALSAEESVTQSDLAERLEGAFDAPVQESSVRARLTGLRQEGVVERERRGHYKLVRAQHDETPALQELIRRATRFFRPEALRRAVVWDATPYLALTEDGAPGTRLVVEHPHVRLLRDELAAPRADQDPWHVVHKRTTKPLGDLIWSLDDDHPWIKTGVLLLERERLGATGLTDHGYRTPFRERVLVEFLSLTTDPTIGSPIADWILHDSRTRFNRLWQAGQALNVLPDVAILLAALGPRLPAPLFRELQDATLPVVRELAWKSR